MKSITHVLNKNYATFNKITFVKIKNALFVKDKAPSEAVHTNCLSFPLRLWHPHPRRARK